MEPTREVFVRLAERLTVGLTPQNLGNLVRYIFTNEELAHIIFGGNTETELYQACYNEAERRDGKLDETVF